MQRRWTYRVPAATATPKPSGGAARYANWFGVYWIGFPHTTFTVVADDVPAGSAPTYSCAFEQRRGGD